MEAAQKTIENVLDKGRCCGQHKNRG